MAETLKLPEGRRRRPLPVRKKTVVAVAGRRVVKPDPDPIPEKPPEDAPAPAKPAEVSQTAPKPARRSLAEAFYAVFGDEPPPVLYRVKDGKAVLRRMPLALNTRKMLPRWMRERGYTDAQVKEASRLVGALVRQEGYMLRCAAENAMRLDLDGNPVEAVSAEHRRMVRRGYEGKMRMRRQG